MKINEMTPIANEQARDQLSGRHINDGHGDWSYFGPLEECSWRIAGIVEAVYKRAM